MFFFSTANAQERAGRSGSRSYVTVPASRSLTVATSPLAELEIDETINGDLARVRPASRRASAFVFGTFRLLPSCHHSFHRMLVVPMVWCSDWELNWSPGKSFTQLPEPRV